MSHLKILHSLDFCFCGNNQKRTLPVVFIIVNYREKIVLQSADDWMPATMSRHEEKILRSEGQKDFSELNWIKS